LIYRITALKPQVQKERMLRSMDKDPAFTANKPRVLFTFVEAGFGHIMPMHGIYEEFKKKYGERVECLPVNIFSDSSYPEIKAMGKEISDSTKLASRNWLFNKAEGIAHHFSSRFTHWFLDIHFGKAEKLVIKEMKELSPDLVVATYYLPTHISAKANRQGKMDVLTATYSPDPYIYPAWDRRCDLFLVNNETAYQMSLKKGFKKDKVKLIPCVLRKEITDLSAKKDEARDLLGLNKDRFNVVFSNGAYGEKHTHSILKALVTSDLDMDLTIICGKSPDSEKTVKEYTKIKSPSIGLNIIDYTDKMAEYMRAADVILGKAGSNTIKEAAYLGAPMLITAKASHLEEKAADWAVKEKVAICETKPKKIVGLLRKCIETPDYLINQLTGFSKYSQSDGAEKAADAIFELLKTKFSNL